MSVVQLKNGVVPVSPALAALRAEAAEYADRDRSSSTQATYRGMWEAFRTWCRDHEVSVLPVDPEHVGLYLTELARTKKFSTIKVVLAALKHTYKEQGYTFNANDPEIARVVGGIKRTHGTRQEGAGAILPEHLTAMLATLPSGLKGLRDRALLLVGFAGAFRRSELVGLQVHNLTFSDRGVEVLIERSKTDQEGAGQTVAIPYGRNKAMCPVLTLLEWLHAAGVADGFVFRSVRGGGVVGADGLEDKVVERLVKSAAEAAGLSDLGFSAHSLRAGLATSAALAGASLMDIKRTTRHKSTEMVARYVRVADQWRENATGAVL